MQKEQTDKADRHTGMLLVQSGMHNKRAGLLTRKEEAAFVC